MESEKIIKLLQLNDEIKRNSLEKLNLSLKDLADAVRITTEWFVTQPHLPKITPDTKQIECIYMSCKGSIERTKTCLDAYFSLKNIYPDVFTNRDPLLPEMKTAADGMMISLQPILTDAGNRIVCAKCLDGEFNPYLLYKNLFMMIDIRMHYDHADGCVYVFDMTDFNMGHATKTTPALLKMAIFALQEAFVARIKGLHIINVPKYGEPFVQLIRSLLKPKLRSRIFIHKNYEALHNHIDKKLLPSDFDGDLESIETVHNDWFDQIKEMRNWFLEGDKHATDESKRSGKPLVNEMLGVHGSFRKLEVD